MDTPGQITSTSLRAPKAGAIAGIVFAVLLTSFYVLIRVSVPENPHETGLWLSEGWSTVDLALNLVPFAGIAFLWFIGVLRDRMGVLEDRFFSTVFLGSGLLFLAMLFAATAIAGGIIVMYGMAPGRLLESGLYSFGRLAVYQITNIFALKMAGVFMITTSTLAIRLGLFPRWTALLGYALALFLILSVGSVYWAPIVFPLWVLLVSVQILVANLRSAPPPAGVGSGENQP